MSEARLEVLGGGRFRLHGELDFDSVPALLATTQTLFADGATPRVSLATVSHIDSAGLALLVEWRRAALQHTADIAFDDIPPQMLALAQVCGVDELLALDGQ